jgi:hypothetical protein
VKFSGHSLIHGSPAIKNDLEETERRQVLGSTLTAEIEDFVDWSKKLN